MMHPSIHIVITADQESLELVALTIAFLATVWFMSKAMGYLKRTKE